MKTFLAVILTVLLSFGVCYADNGTAPVVEPAPLIQTQLSLDGDALYVFGDVGVALGGGLNLARVYDIVNLRIQYARSTSGDGRDLFGGGISVSIPAIIDKVGGSWLVPEVLPEVGLVGLADITDGKLKGHIGIMITALSWPF